MDNTWGPDSVRAGAGMRPPIWIAMIALLLLSIACGGNGPQSNQINLYPAGSKTDEDIDRELKFDARVVDYDASGDKLVVNVNQAFVSSPPGIQERALGYWYNIFQAARTGEGSKPAKGLAVIAKHEDSEVAKWTADEGYKPVVTAKTEGGEAGSEN